MTRIKCLVCGKVLESKHRRDFKVCGCPNQTMLDGGDSYLRFDAKDMSKIGFFITLGRVRNEKTGKIGKYHVINPIIPNNKQNSWISLCGIRENLYDCKNHTTDREFPEFCRKWGIKPCKTCLKKLGKELINE